MFGWTRRWRPICERIQIRAVTVSDRVTLKQSEKGQVERSHAVVIDRGIIGDEK